MNYRQFAYVSTLAGFLATYACSRGNDEDYNPVATHEPASLATQSTELQYVELPLPYAENASFIERTEAIFALGKSLHDSLGTSIEIKVGSGGSFYIGGLFEKATVFNIPDNSFPSATLRDLDELSRILVGSVE